MTVRKKNVHLVSRGSKIEWLKYSAEQDDIISHYPVKRKRYGGRCDEVMKIWSVIVKNSKFLLLNFIIIVLGL